MNDTKVKDGAVHNVPRILKDHILSNPQIHEVWQNLTPLARNEWICWITSAKKEETRQKRISTMEDKLNKGMRRPCCWAGCPHR